MDLTTRGNVDVAETAHVSLAPSLFPFKNRSMQVLVEPIVTYIENPFPRFLHTAHGP